MLSFGTPRPEQNDLAIHPIPLRYIYFVAFIFFGSALPFYLDIIIYTHQKKLCVVLHLFRDCLSSFAGISSAADGCMSIYPSEFSSRLLTFRISPGRRNPFHPTPPEQTKELRLDLIIRSILCDLQVQVVSTA